MAEEGDGFGTAVSLLDHDADGITTLDGSGKTFATKGSKTFGLGALASPTPGVVAFGEALGR